MRCNDRIAIGIYGYSATLCIGVPVLSLPEDRAIWFLNGLLAPCNNVSRIRQMNISLNTLDAKLRCV
jgi:hypothetical protein